MIGVDLFDQLIIGSGRLVVAEAPRRARHAGERGRGAARRAERKQRGASALAAVDDKNRAQVSS